MAELVMNQESEELEKESDMKQKYKKAGIVIGFLILLIVFMGIWLKNQDIEMNSEPCLQAALEKQKTKETTEECELEIHYIDVGQGDATFIRCGQETMLIDAGSSEQGVQLQLYLEKQGIEHLDYLVLTHPDADHIGAADVIVTKYDIGTVFFGDLKKQGAEYEELLEALDYKHLKHSVPPVGTTFVLGEAEFVILAPNANYEDANNSSIALLFEHGENTFLFTGDCKEEAEWDIMENGLDIDCDVYKVAHHGSNSSSSKKFLEAITPQAAVISCGENDYGHPHETVLKNLKEMGVQVFRTDEQGTVVAVSDGKNISWKFSCDDKGTEVVSDYIVANKKSGVFHKSDCTNLPAEWNQIILKNREDAIEAGFTDPCNYCNP